MGDGGSDGGGGSAGGVLGGGGTTGGIGGGGVEGGKGTVSDVMPPAGQLQPPSLHVISPVPSLHAQHRSCSRASKELGVGQVAPPTCCTRSHDVPPLLEVWSATVPADAVCIWCSCTQPTSVGAANATSMNAVPLLCAAPGQAWPAATVPPISGLAASEKGPLDRSEPYSDGVHSRAPKPAPHEMPLSVTVAKWWSRTSMRSVSFAILHGTESTRAESTVHCPVATSWLPTRRIRVILDTARTSGANRPIAASAMEREGQRRPHAAC